MPPHFSLLTPAHGRAALMGVFGMLAIALMVFAMRQVSIVDIIRSIPGSRGENRNTMKAFAYALGCLLAAWLAIVPQAWGQAQREEILLSPEERETVLFRMRELLKSVSIILEGTLTNNLAQIAKAGRDAGLQGGAHMPPSVQPKLPLAFRQLAQATHRTFDDIAGQAEQARNPDPILRMLSANLQRCVACHEAYGVRNDISN